LKQQVLLDDSMTRNAGINVMTPTTERGALAMNKTKSISLHLPQVTCRVVGPSAEFVGKQALLYASGISAESVGAQAIHLQVVTIPPGGRAKAHRHVGHETGVYILSGESGMWYGQRLEEHLSAKSGDFVYIPADMPHLPYNLSDTENCVAVIARTDPNEQESVVLLPELDQNRP
jgi:uncharacterized RmlC-like cupin family protein